MNQPDRYLLEEPSYAVDILSSNYTERYHLGGDDFTFGLNGAAIEVSDFTFELRYGPDERLKAVTVRFDDLSEAMIGDLLQHLTLAGSFDPEELGLIDDPSSVTLSLRSEIIDTVVRARVDQAAELAEILDMVDDDGYALIMDLGYYAIVGLS